MTEITTDRQAHASAYTPTENRIHEDPAHDAAQGLNPDASPGTPAETERAPDRLQTIVSPCRDGCAAIGEIASALDNPKHVGFLLLLISPDYDPEAIAEGLARYVPHIPNAGCSTSGAIAIERTIDHGILAIAFPKDTFEIVTSPLFDHAHLTFEDGVDLARNLRASLAQIEGPNDGRLFALTLLDGLSRREELLLAALEQVMDSISVVGGSSGDNLSLTKTFAVRNGEVQNGASVIVLVRTPVDFRSFKSDRFLPTDKRLIVTACDPANRLVRELNAEPAADAYARAIGVPRETLDHSVCCGNPLLVQVDGELFCRSVQAVNPDGSLVFYSAVETGVVFILGEVTGLTESLAHSMATIEAEMGDIDLILGFDCVQRKVEAEHIGAGPALRDLYRRHRVAGFWTYGEQYHGLHLNYTFTGLAIGRKGA